MSEPNTAEKLAKEIAASVNCDSFPQDSKVIEARLRPTFDLLARIHELAKQARHSDPLVRFHLMEAIESLTYKYDQG